MLPSCALFKVDSVPFIPFFIKRSNKGNNQPIKTFFPDFSGLRITDHQAEPLAPPTMPHPLSTGAPLASAGSGGSGSGHNMIMNPGWPSAPPLRNEPSPHQWEAPWMGPPSGSGSASTTTYGAIYNPAAPPPSANYTAMASNYSGYGSGRESAYGGQMHPLGGIHHSSGNT
jgi:hypothetical protein